ncbi:pilus assembly protein [Pseudomonas syringae]|nr:pilus assembly protein [Pseudomonas syringae]
MVFFACSISFSGHDLQRVLQVVVGIVSVFFVAGFYMVKPESMPLNRGVFFLFFFILLFGLISSLMARQPLWAVIELSVLLICYAVSNAFFQVRKTQGLRLDNVLCYFVVIICFIKVVQFVAAALAGLMSSEHVLDADLLLQGFSNKRFYGQFQTFTLPLLILPLLIGSNRRAIKTGILFLAGLWWMIAISGGTRGTWLGMASAVCVLSLLGNAGRRWAGWQLLTASVGLFLYVLMFSVLPGWLGIEISNFAGDRLNTSLSAREVLWQQAWTMIKERPMLGFGPMHFADIWNAVAAHPHQAILQWASEWGIPSTLCVMGLALYGLSTTGFLIRKRGLSDAPVDMMRLCLFASLVGALTQSMVDGVIVMPYSQLWLAIIVGWLLALHEWAEAPRPVNALVYRAWLACLIAAASLLLFVVVRDFPNLDMKQQQFAQDFGGRFLPRFWMQGVIAHTAE